MDLSLCLLCPISRIHIMTPTPPPHGLNAPYPLPSTHLLRGLALVFPPPYHPSPCASIPPPALAFSSPSPVLYLRRRRRACGSSWPALPLVTPLPIVPCLDWPVVMGGCACRAGCGGAVYDYPLYLAIRRGTRYKLQSIFAVATSHRANATGVDYTRYGTMPGPRSAWLLCFSVMLSYMLYGNVNVPLAR
ncbi:hypothetical protein OH77DRAFT_752846 [Trametes cingulata]|nr:hypothetical protein OH77DRAFT_752846 [Trametes cingulata]